MNDDNQSYAFEKVRQKYEKDYFVIVVVVALYVAFHAEIVGLIDSHFPLADYCLTAFHCWKQSMLADSVAVNFVFAR